MEFTAVKKAEDVDFEEIPAKEEGEKGGEGKDPIQSMLNQDQGREDFEEGLHEPSEGQGSFVDPGQEETGKDPSPGYEQEQGSSNDPFTAEVDPTKTDKDEEPESDAGAGGSGGGDDKKRPGKGSGKGKGSGYGNMGVRKICWAMAYATVAKYNIGARRFALYAKGLEMDRDEIKREYSLDKETFDQMVEVYARTYEATNAHENKDPKQEAKWMTLVVFGFMGLELVPSFAGRAWYDVQKYYNWIKYGGNTDEAEEPQKPPMSEPSPPKSEKKEQGGSSEAKKKGGGKSSKGRGKPKGMKRNPTTGRNELPISEDEIDGEKEYYYSWELGEKDRRSWMKRLAPDDERYPYLMQYDDPAVKQLLEIEVDPDTTKEEKKEKAKEVKKRMKTFKQLQA